MQTFLLCLIVFILAADESAFTKVLSHPIVACTMVGAAMGNTALGMSVGGVLEMMVLGMPELKSYTLVSVIAVILAISAGAGADMSVTAASAVSAGACLIGNLANTGSGFINTLLLGPGRKAAEKGDSKGIGRTVLIGLVLRGVLFAVLAAVLASGSGVISGAYTAMAEKAGWLISGLERAGELMKYVGLAVILRNLKADEMFAALPAGFAAGAVFASTLNTGAALLLSVFAAAAIAAYDFHKGSASAAPAENTNKGGAQKWW